MTKNFPGLRRDFRYDVTLAWASGCGGRRPAKTHGEPGAILVAADADGPYRRSRIGYIALLRRASARRWLGVVWQRSDQSDGAFVPPV